MAMHVVDYSYDIPEWGSELIDMDVDLMESDKGNIAYSELKELYPDIKNINIENIKELIEE